MSQKTSLGRIVIYNTTLAEQETMRANNINVQAQLPAVIVAAWANDLINAKVFLDGGFPDIWKTSIHLHAPEVIADGQVTDVSNINKEGTWEWPVISK